MSGKPTTSNHPALNKEYLYKWYVQMQFSARQIARDIGCEHHVVTKALRKFGIPIAPKKAPKGEKKNTRTMGKEFKYLITEVLTQPVLDELYTQRNQSVSQIAKLLSCKESSVANALEFHGIKMRDAKFKEGFVPAHKGTTKETNQHAANISKGKEGKPNYKIRKQKHYRWKGGPSDEETAARSTLEYTKWKRAVYKRDNWTCQCCGRNRKETRICAHHIKYFDTHPNLRYEVSNGVVLCRGCHSREHRNDVIWQDWFITTKKID